MQENGWIMVKDKNRTFINLEVAVSKVISSLVKNIFRNINVEPSDLNIVPTTESSSC